VVFIRKSAGRSGATKVQIAERRGGRNHILEHVGTARSEAELAVLMAEARRRLRPGQDALDLKLPGMPQQGRSGVITGKRSAVLWHVLTSVYARLGFDAIDDAAFAQLVLARIVEPTSKADALRVLDEVGVPTCRCARCSGRCSEPRSAAIATRSRPRASPTPPGVGICRCASTT
jgi:hypothetical protein